MRQVRENTVDQLLNGVDDQFVWNNNQVVVELIVLRRPPLAVKQ